MTNAKNELDQLLNEAIEIGIRLIEKHDRHNAFALTITVSGQRMNLACTPESPDSDTLLDDLRDHLREKCSPPWTYRAIALANDVQCTHPKTGKVTRAIQVTLDHLGYEAVTCYLPFETSSGKLVPGELFAVEPEEQFFSLGH